jgi:hypothetical protein
MAARTGAPQRTTRQLAAILIAAGSLAARGATAANTGERVPRATSGQFSNASNGLACDGIVAQASGNTQSQVFSLYGLSVPGNATITGIMVRVRGNDGAERNRSFLVSLSWDGGRRFSGAVQTPSFEANAPLRDLSVGGSRSKWGHAWTRSDLSDKSFRLKLQAQMPGGSEPISLDCAPVTVFYDLPTPPPQPPSPTPEASPASVPGAGARRAPASHGTSSTLPTLLRDAISASAAAASASR